jgi:UDP-N-acetylmuramoyl-L-alanyl-D-glutamate--2,6-diaminopimelate ligase
MLLRDLASGAGGRLIGDGDVDIAAIEFDSRAVTPGALFVAVLGFSVDGHAYLGRAVENGAAAVVVQEGHEGMWHAVVEGAGVDVLVLPDTRVGLAKLSAALFGHPARKLKVLGVTGTDGKTSLCHLIAHVFHSTGHKAGLISTAECRIGEELLPDTGRFTTPEAPQVQWMLSRMVETGCEWAVIEATSHGLALHRVDECEYDVAVLTNIGRDHLDFHGSETEYVAAKGRLFEMLDMSVAKGIEKTAVLNEDDETSEYFASRTQARILRYSLYGGAGVEAKDVRAEGWDSRFTLVVGDGQTETVMHRGGRFNVSNALAAAAVATTAGIDLERIAQAISTWPGAPGRMEVIDCGQPFSVIVDFAHAPESLRRVLLLLREHSRGRLIAVFGCIGEHDKERRAGMGQAAAELADYTFITDDNPYSENRDAILEDIASAMRAAGKREGHDFAVVPDRREAVAQAISMAVDEDAVLLAGKGHETEVHLGAETYECDDRVEARRALRELGYGE